MQERKVVVTRVHTSDKFFAPAKPSAQERISEYVYSQKQISAYPFSADFSVKAAKRRSGGGGKNAAADNKEKRKKASKLLRIGTHCYDPNATQKPGQIFRLHPKINLDGQLGDVANVGWVDPPKYVTKDEYLPRIKQLISQSEQNPIAVSRPAKLNKRTGQIEAKSLGRTIGQAAGNIGMAAVRALGIVLDPDGRMRCPPGVPAANQFTDEIGSNCFDFSPLVGRALVRIAERFGQNVIQSMQKIDETLPVVRNRDGKLVMLPAETYRTARSISPSGARPIIPMVPVVGPVSPADRWEATVLNPAIAAASPIPDNKLEEEFEAAIRAADPRLPDAEVKRLAELAAHRARMVQTLNEEKRATLNEVEKIIGRTIDEADPLDVQKALHEAIKKISGPRSGIDMSGIFGTNPDLDMALAEHRNRMNEGVALVAIKTLKESDPAKWGALVAKHGGEDELIKKIQDALNSGKTIDAVFPSATADEIQLFQKAKTFEMKVQSFEIGQLIGLMNQIRNNPEMMKRLNYVRFLDPLDTNNAGTDASYTVESGTTDGTTVLELNPLGMLYAIRHNPDTSTEFQLFEGEGSGTEVAKLQAVASSITSTAKDRMRDEWFAGIRDFGEMREKIGKGQEFQQFLANKAAGLVARAQYVMHHELIHHRQVLKLYAILDRVRSTSGLIGEDGKNLTNMQMMGLAADLLHGNKNLNLKDRLGQPYQYFDLLRDPTIERHAIENLPEVVIDLLGKGVGGRYAKKEYWYASYMKEILSQPTEASKLQKWNELYSLYSTLDPNSAEAQALYKALEIIKEAYDASSHSMLGETWKTLEASMLQQSNKAFMELQAEVGAGVATGVIKRTPEIEAFLAPLNDLDDITDMRSFGGDYTPRSMTARDVSDQQLDVIKSDLRKLWRGKVRQVKQGVRDATRVGKSVSSKDHDDELTEMALEGTVALASRDEVSRWAKSVSDSVLDFASSKQKQVLEGKWQNSRWNTGDATDWRKALVFAPDEMADGITNQMIPFTDLVDNSILPEGVPVEILLPGNALGFDGEDIRGAGFAIDSHFVGIIKSNDDISSAGGRVPVSESQRVIIAVPEGFKGLPDKTPGTHRGQMGSMILPPGEIEIVGRRDDGTVMARMVSQRSAAEHLRHVRQTLQSLESQDGRTLRQRIAARRGMQSIDRSEVWRAEEKKIRAAVAMQMDPKNSRLASQIDYDPQERRLTVYYKNGTNKEFENVGYSQVRDAGAKDRPDDLIRELEARDERALMSPNRSRTAKSVSDLTGVDSASEFRNDIAESRTLDILVRAKQKNIDLDKQEKNIFPIVKSRLQSELQYAQQRVKLAKLDPNVEQSIRNMVRQGIPSSSGIFSPERWGTEYSDLEILRNFSTLDSNFETRLAVSRIIADEKGDKELVGQIDKFINDVSNMTPEEFAQAYENAAKKFENVFDERPVVVVDDALRIVETGRYLTTHQGTQTMGGRNTFDPEYIRSVRRSTENRLMNIPLDTDDETQSLRPSSGMTVSTHHSDDRSAKLRQLYGQDVEIQHDYPTASNSGNTVATTGSTKQSFSQFYGVSSIILRREVADRTLTVNGDTISNVSESGEDIVEASGRLSNLSQNSQLAAAFFSPESVLFTDRTGRNNTLASASHSGKQYVESLTLGSFETPDIQAIVGPVGEFRGSEMWGFSNPSIFGVNPKANQNVTTLIGAARTRSRLKQEKGIDLVFKSQFFNLDEVEPFNSAMTEKWVARQIEANKFSGVSASDLIANSETTPYEALLRYMKINAEKTGQTPLFDHPDNPKSVATNEDRAKVAMNFVKMVEDEIKRVNPNGRSARSVSNRPNQNRVARSVSNFEVTSQAAKNRVDMASARVSNLELALERLERTGEWRGEEFGVTVSLHESMYELDDFDSGTPTNLTQEQIEELPGGLNKFVERVKSKLEISRKEKVFQEHQSNSKQTRREQNVLDIEDIPDEELEVLFREGMELFELTQAQRDDELSGPNGMTAALHVGSPELAGGMLDPGFTTGGDVDGSSGNTGALNVRKVRDYITMFEKTTGELTGAQGMRDAIDSNGGRYTPKNQYEADYLNDVFGLEKKSPRFESGQEFDLLANGPDFFTMVDRRQDIDGYKNAVKNGLTRRIDESEKRVSKMRKLAEKIQESPQFGFVSAYLASEDFTVQGYFGRDAGKAIPKDVGTYLTEWEQKRFGGVKGNTIVDQRMWNRWSNHLRGTGWLVPNDDGSTVTTELGPGSEEKQIVGKVKPLFGFSFPKNYGHSSVSRVESKFKGEGGGRSARALIGTALLARAMRLHRSGKPVTPETVLESRRSESVSGNIPAERTARSASGAITGSGISRRLARRTAESRTTNEKLTSGPIDFDYGFDSTNFPRVATTEEQKQKFGRTKKQVKRYFADKYGVTVVGGIPDGNKYPEQEGAAYAAMQALDDVLSNLENVADILKGEDLKVNFNSSWTARSETMGSFALNRRVLFNFGKQKLEISMYPKNMVEQAKGTAEQLRQNRLKNVLASMGISASLIPELFADLGSKNVSDSDMDYIVSQRMSYGNMVHEMGHLLDYLGREGNERKLKLKPMIPMWVSGAESQEDIQNRAYLSGQDANYGDIPKVSGYGAASAQESLAEAWTAWFLFARRPDIQVKPWTTTDSPGGGRTQRVMDGVQSILYAAAPTIKPLFERLGDGVKTGNQEDVGEDEQTTQTPFTVLLYTLAPFIMDNEEAA